jgi:Uma2 family endonuclease
MSSTFRLKKEHYKFVHLGKGFNMHVESKDKIYTVEEYVEHELKSAVRSEFINGQLFEMAGEKDINNEIAGSLYILLTTLLKSLGYFVYNRDVKVKIFGENKYYYPDVFVTKELKNENNKYVKYEPILIIEVVSETTHTTDYVDKYVAYIKIPSLVYYLIIEPETTLVTCFTKGNDNEWSTSKYTSLDDVIKLGAVDNLSFQLRQIYL